MTLTGDTSFSQTLIFCMQEILSLLFKVNQEETTFKVPLPIKWKFFIYISSVLTLESQKPLSSKKITSRQDSFNHWQMRANSSRAGDVWLHLAPRSQGVKQLLAEVLPALQICHSCCSRKRTRRCVLHSLPLLTHFPTGCACWGCDIRAQCWRSLCKALFCKALLVPWSSD